MDDIAGRLKTMMKPASFEIDMLVLGTVLLFLVLCFFAIGRFNIISKQSPLENKFFFTPYLKFAYVSFIKPHAGVAGGGQQSALESFYSAQASVYDLTRKQLLRGREDMLGLVAAQLRCPARQRFNDDKPIWFDIGGGTGYNIEVMDQLLTSEGGIGAFFSQIYLIDLSPSLCEIARERVKRFNWENVTILCEDARSLHHSCPRTADVITMSYSLSMIPDFYGVVDQVTSLLAPTGIVGVCDFYVQSIVDVSSRNWTGGTFNRHVNWLGRMFWRTWFDADRVNLDSGRRDYVEYKFGTIISASQRNYALGGIPYYLFIGCQISAETVRGSRATPLSTPGSSPSLSAHDFIERHDASLTESPYLSPQEYRAVNTLQPSTPVRSKFYESAIVNLASNLPLPSTYYQLHPWRTTYSDLQPKHTQFASDYIYAFNWEDPAVDLSILNLQASDVLVTITSAGDNILDYYANSNVRRVHAIDLNPNQNHLLELKVACFAAGLTHSEIWSLFGDGRHPTFRSLLIHRLSPHLSSHAFQFWLSNNAHFSPRSRGLYAVSGGSRHAITLCRYIFRLTGLTQTVQTFCSVSTLAEQREIWRGKLRHVMLSWPLHVLLVSSDWWCWRAAGVPAQQRQLIVDDYAAGLTDDQRKQMGRRRMAGEAIFKFLVDTLDPVAEWTLLSRENYFYHMVLKGAYSKSCAPRWLGERGWRRLSRDRGRVLDGLRIHTDEFLEVVKRMRAGSVGAVIVMDSMDWLEVPDLNTVKRVAFLDLKEKHARSRSRSKSRSTEGVDAAQTQINEMLRVLKVGGKVLLRSAALKPWYIELFERMEDEDTGCKVWNVKCMGRRENGKCIDRVNMYASCWLIVKVGESLLHRGTVESPRIKSVLKKRRTSASGSEAGSSSSSDGGQMSPQALRGRNRKVLESSSDGDTTETESRSRRGIVEDLMLPNAAIEIDGDGRF